LKFIATYSDSTISFDLRGRFTIGLTGSRDYIVQAVQQLAWIGAALQLSDTGAIQHNDTTLKQDAQGVFTVLYTRAMPTEEETLCWVPLFRNPVIARGFPIPYRGNGEIGLESPIDILASLIGATNSVDFQDGLLLKGFSSLLVPVKLTGDSIQWHLVVNRSGKRIKYSEADVYCPTRLPLSVINRQTLKNTRAFLAWWGESYTSLGTQDAVYTDITPSKTRSPSKELLVTGATIGFSKIGTGTISLALAPKTVECTSLSYGDWKML
jgi:hypothetical protein